MSDSNRLGAAAAALVACASVGAAPSQLVVTTSDFTGTGSISEALVIAEAAVQAGAEGAVISFALPAASTITFSSPLLISRTFDEDHELAIEGGGTITLSGGGASQLFVVNGESGLFPDVDAPVGHLVLRDLELRDGFTNDTGGAIYSDGDVRIERSTLVNNRAIVTGNVFTCLLGPQCEGGGAIFNGGFAQLTIVESELRGNEASGGIGDVGGAISNAGAMIVSESLFFSNQAGLGGGAIASGGLVAILDSQFVGNQTDALIAGFNGGGAILNGSSFSGLSPFNSMTIVRSELRDNRTIGQSVDGGAIVSNAELVIAESLLVGNEVLGFGSEAGALKNNSSPLLVLNTTFSGNAARGQSASGGALVNTIGEISLVHTAFVDNEVTEPFISNGFGGAIKQSDDPISPINIINSVFLNNRAVAEEANDIRGGVRAFNSVIEDPSGVVFIEQDGVLIGDGASNIQVGADLYPAALALDQLADNGGPTSTYAIGNLVVDGVSNPLLDRGDPARALTAINVVSAQAQELLVLAGVDLAALTDQRGVAAMPGPRNDLGAYERVANDADGDGVDDGVDNCTERVNSEQTDTDGDGFGNACDPDLNNDGIVNFVDLGQLRQRFFTTDADADFNNDGVVNFMDLGVMRAFFFGPPGPSA
ncbi:MAG: thrombospondin type 3 repeat-containing protein [Gammaproteobacteria bacterium]